MSKLTALIFAGYLIGLVCALSVLSIGVHVQKQVGQAHAQQSV